MISVFSNMLMLTFHAGKKWGTILGTWFPRNLAIWREIFQLQIKKYIRNRGNFDHVPDKLDIFSSTASYVTFKPPWEVFFSFLIENIFLKTFEPLWKSNAGGSLQNIWIFKCATQINENMVKLQLNTNFTNKHSEQFIMYHLVIPQIATDTTFVGAVKWHHSWSDMHDKFLVMAPHMKHPKDISPTVYLFSHGLVSGWKLRRGKVLVFWALGEMETESSCFLVSFRNSTGDRLVDSPELDVTANSTKSLKFWPFYCINFLSHNL